MNPEPPVIISYDGQQYPFDLDDVTVKQAMKIEKYMGCPFAEWGRKLESGEDIRARQVLGWLILHQGGETPIEDTDFKLVALGNAIAEAFTAEEEKARGESEPVPTGAVLNGHAPEAALSPPSSPPSSGEISR